MSPSSRNVATHAPGNGTAGPSALKALDRLRASADLLRTSPSAKASRQMFAELEVFLSGLAPEFAAAAVVEFLNSGEDLPVSLPFAIGPDGFLTSASSLRVFLLDYLARVDRTAAATYAERILQTMTSPDEWAVSLRNYALANTTPAACLFLQQKVQAMIHYEAWQKNPSAGFLEAFDVIVFIGGQEGVASMASFLRPKEDQAVAHAAYLTLDRLILHNPVTVLSALARDPDLLKGRETTRAQYYARADVRDSRQRQLLENYLVNPQLEAAELDAFVGIYPNANYMISNNLLTRTETPDRAALSKRDFQALQVVGDWLVDPRFARIRPQLKTIQNRLKAFVSQGSDHP